MNGAGPAHGKEADECLCVVGGGQLDTVRHSELSEHMCSGELDGLLGEGLVDCQCDRGGSHRVHGGERGVRAHWLRGLLRIWRQLRLQRRRGRNTGGSTGGSDVGGGVGDWDASSGTGWATHVEAARRSRTLGVRELVTA